MDYESVLGFIGSATLLYEDNAYVIIFIFPFECIQLIRILLNQ